jgi:hypothetical protein
MRDCTDMYSKSNILKQHPGFVSFTKEPISRATTPAKNIVMNDR